MNKKLFILLALMSVFLSSCSSYKRIAFLQDMEVDKDYIAQTAPDPVVRINDKLKIFVSSGNPILAAPFNMTIGTQPVDDENGTVKENQNAEDMKVYTVDRNGNINFPVLGDVHVEGLTLDGLKEKLSEGIISSGYLRDPIILSSFQNFKITVIGEMGPTVMNIEDGVVNIFELMAMTGGMSNSAVRNDVRVIRTENGIRRAYSIDMQSVSCFDSPVFYLQQNDMVYVQPRNKKMDDVTSFWMSAAHMFLTVLSTFSAVLYWLR